MKTLLKLVADIDQRSPGSEGHSYRVARLSGCLAAATGCSRSEQHNIYLTGLLHDVGKISVPPHLLAKQEELTRDEYCLVRQHSKRGGQILQSIRHCRRLLPGVVHHHERIDGHGYPHNLSGSQIPLAARIISIADSFDAMTTPRNYRPARSIPSAMVELQRQSARQFDPDLVNKFLEMDLPHVIAELWDNTMPLLHDISA